MPTSALLPDGTEGRCGHRPFSRMVRRADVGIGPYDNIVKSRFAYLSKAQANILFPHAAPVENRGQLLGGDGFVPAQKTGGKG